MTQHRLTASLRFWAKVDRTAPNGCWVWTGSLYPSGYGQGWSRDRSCLAHRISWEFSNGPVPSGLMVLHRCDNRPCVNPSHLFLGTHRDNTQDMIAKGRQNFDYGRAQRTHCRHGHEYTPANTAVDKKGARVCRACQSAKSRRHYWRTAETTV